MVMKKKSVGASLLVPVKISSSKVRLLPPKKSSLSLLAPQKKIVVKKKLPLVSSQKISLRSVPDPLDTLPSFSGFEKKKKLGPVPSPPKKIPLRSVPDPLDTLPPFSDFEKKREVTQPLAVLQPEEKISSLSKQEEKPSFMSRFKERFTSTQTEASSFDLLEVEHALFAESDYYGLRKKNVFPKMTKKNLVEKIPSLESVPFPPLTKRVLAENAFPELKQKDLGSSLSKDLPKPSFMSRFKEKLVSKSSSRPSFDILEVEHALFAENDYYGLRKKNVFPKMTKKKVAEKILREERDEGSLFQEHKEIYFPELQQESVPEQKGSVPQSVFKDFSPVDDSRALTIEIPQTFVPKKSSLQILSELDPLKKSMELLDKCQKSLQKKNYDFAVLYSEELIPFYKKLAPDKQEMLYVYIQDVQQRIQMLHFDRVHERLKKMH